MGRQRLQARVTGRVQQVGFRGFVMQEARRLRLTGFVRNLGREQVEVVAEGEQANLEQLVEALRQGPAMARVTNVQVSWSEALGDQPAFTVRPSG